MVNGQSVNSMESRKDRKASQSIFRFEHYKHENTICNHIGYELISQKFFTEMCPLQRLSTSFSYDYIYYAQ